MLKFKLGCYKYPINPIKPWVGVLHWLPKVNLLVLRGSREAVVEMPPEDHASTVVVMATILGIVPLQRRVEPAML